VNIWSALTISDPGPLRVALSGDPTAVKMTFFTMSTVDPVNLAVSLTYDSTEEQGLLLKVWF
jgi:hypothetical protein